MPLAAGTWLGPYEVLGLSGAGGMGEVYKARDTRLDRTVAIKILPAELNAEPDRRTRFEREARAVAALNHPHICTLHDIGAHDGTTYLVMEYLAGESLAQRLTRGPVSVAQALEFGAQIADALDAAHKHGIIHRDLKPANVMLTTGGAGRSGVTSAKLLDFGLAKLVAHGERPALASDASAPTQTLPMTARGVIVGTLQYMAPEQLEGKEADARTDLWALGAILYEMVTGKRAFQADSDVSLIGAILNLEPAGLAMLQPLTPPSLERLVTRCLAKHPDDRWDSAHDVADELRWIGQGSGAQVPVPVEQSTKRLWLTRAARGLAVAAVAFLGVVAGQWVKIAGLSQVPGKTVEPVTHLDLVLPADSPLWIDPLGTAPSLALSPDGSVLAYTCARGDTTQLCLRRLGQSGVLPMAGTENARYPVFSPDGRSVLFCVTTRYLACDVGAPLKRLSIADARVDLIGTTPEGVGFPLSLAWTAGGRLLISGFDGIWTMPASGGAASPLVRRDDSPGDVSYGVPDILPDGERMIFEVVRREKGSLVYDVRVRNIATGDQRVLLKNAGMARYLPTGHLLYHEGTFVGRWVVAPFDAARLEVGAPRALGEPVRRVGAWGAFALSRSGTLLYLPVEAGRVLTWVDRQQRSVPASRARGPWQNPQLSPDGRRVAVEVVHDQSPPSISVVDLDRGLSTEIAPAGTNPIWTPDGTRVTIGSTLEERLSWQAADGSGTPEILHQGKDEQIFNNGSWSPDGRLLAYMLLTNDVWPIFMLSKDGGTWTPRRFGSEPFDGGGPRFSPDGHWIAYHSNVPGPAYHVYIRAYPGADHRTQISVGGGYDAVWSRDGRELFYRNGDRFYAVALRLSPTISVAAPQFLFSGPYLDTGVSSHSYDVSRDGQRFLVVQVSDEERAPRRFHLVQNWFEELKAKVPAGGAK